MANAVSKVAVASRRARQQKVVIERHDDCGAYEWWLMHDNGNVEVFDHASAALKAVQRLARRGNKGVTITTIEWRGVAAGWRPPSM